MKLLRAIGSLMRRRGPGYVWYLLCGWLLPRIVFQRPGALPARIIRRLCPAVPTSALREKARELTSAPDPANFTSWRSWPVAPAVRAAVDAACANSSPENLLLGRIDEDGRLLPIFGELPGFVSVTIDKFVERRRFDLTIVLCGDCVLIRKDYRGDTTTFVREWALLVVLMGKVNVPAVHHVEEERTILFRNLVQGKTVRELLVEGGAQILNAQTTTDSALVHLAPQKRIAAIWVRGRDVLTRVLNQESLRQVEEQLGKIHCKGVAGISLTWGNVVIDPGTNEPWFIDLDKARLTRFRKSLGFQLLRDDEREQLNELYGLSLLTEATARAALAEQSRKMPGWYAPIDFGRGLSVGGFWSADSGTGRWECVNGPALNHLLSGKRVLDLGSNNGIMPLMMLRAGASEVLGVELSSDYAECAQLVRRIFEWRDERRYELRMHLGNMLDVLYNDWGQFDLVTAFCSLYYLSPDEMTAVVRRAAELAPVMVLQAKIDTRPSAAENKAAKSSLQFLQQLLLKNGFPYVEIHVPKGFSRPIAVGRQRDVTTSASTVEKVALHRLGGCSVHVP